MRWQKGSDLPCAGLKAFPGLAEAFIALAEVFKISINGTALFFMIPNLFQPQKVHAMAAIWLLPLTFIVYYFVFKFVIEKFNLKTPGREDAAIKLMSKKEYNAIKNNEDGGEKAEDKEADLEDEAYPSIGELLQYSGRTFRIHWISTRSKRGQIEVWVRSVDK